MTKVELAKQLRTEFPDKPTKALGRILYDRNKLSFKSAEDARKVLLHIEGKMGKSSKKAAIRSGSYMAEARPSNPYKLPESDETIYEPYRILGHKRVAIFSDVHVPYHSIDCLTAAIRFVKNERVDGLLLNGDTLDCHMLSRFLRDPKKRNFKQELDTFKALFEVLDRELGCKIYLKIGNHCERYEHFLQQKAGELIGVEEFTFESIIKARARGIEIIGDKRVMKLNALNGIHGHEYIGGISAPVNIARGLYLRGKVSAFQGHNHTTSEHSETDMDGKITTTWSLGCMSELHPAYLPLNKWNHGFAIVDLDTNGVDYEFRNKRIFKGKVL